MVSFTRLGQLGPTVTSEDGELAAPERVLSECNTCFALVLSTREDDHAATHGASE